MSKTDEQVWMAAWRRAGQELAGIRRDAIREADMCRAVNAIGDACESALLYRESLTRSGLEERQALFAKARH